MIRCLTERSRGLQGLLRLALLLGLILPAGRLPGEDLPENPATTFARKNEIKLFVTAADVDAALKALKLDDRAGVRQTVCFFDTGDGALAAHNLILRARQKDDGSGESTVKLRAGGDASDLSEAERAIQPEQDWTNESSPVLSRSLDDDSLANGLVPKVAAGEGKVSALFNENQQKLVAGRMKDFNWDSLKRYGPVAAKVWRQTRKLDGFAEKVTVEIWHLEKDGRSLEVLEISATAKAATEEQAQALAKQFYAAAKASGMGEPTGETKTKKVLDFFKPGR